MRLEIELKNFTVKESIHITIFIYYLHRWVLAR